MTSQGTAVCVSDKVHLPILADDKEETLLWQALQPAHPSPGCGRRPAVPPTFQFLTAVPLHHTH